MGISCSRELKKCQETVRKCNETVLKLENDIKQLTPAQALPVVNGTLEPLNKHTTKRGYTYKKDKFGISFGGRKRTIKTKKIKISKVYRSTRH